MLSAEISKIYDKNESSIYETSQELRNHVSVIVPPST